MYAVQSSLSTDEPMMLLNGNIGFDKDEPGSAYVDGAGFQTELFELDGMGFKAIKINVNSPGGNVVEGFNICNAMLKTKTPVDTYCGGIAASMAASVFLMGRKRIMADYSALMIHSPFGGSDSKMLKQMKSSLIKMLSSRCNCSEEEISKMMEKETWLSAEEALDLGFCTDIEQTSEANQKRMPKGQIRAMWKEANKIQNFIIPNQQNMEPVQGKAVGTSLIAAYLELSTDATEDSVLRAVKAKVNTEVLARTKAEEERDKMKDACEKAQAAMEAAKKELEDCRSKMKDAEDKMRVEREGYEAKAKAEQAATAKAQAGALIDAYVTAGRIKAESKDSWIATAVAQGADHVKALLGDIQINKDKPAEANLPGAANAAPGAGNQATQNDPTKVGMSATHLMARVRANQVNQAK